MKMHNAAETGGVRGRQRLRARMTGRPGAWGALLVEGEGNVIKCVASVVSDSSLKLWRRHAPSPGTAEIQSAK